MNTPMLSPPRRLIRVVVGIYFFLLLLMALFPPLYLSVSGSTLLVLGIPLPIFYWMVNVVLVLLGVWVLYLVEGKVGDCVKEGELA